MEREASLQEKETGNRRLSLFGRMEKTIFNGQLTIALECLPPVANRQQSKQIASLRVPRRSANGRGELLPSRSIERVLREEFIDYVICGVVRQIVAPVSKDFFPLDVSTSVLDGGLIRRSAKDARRKCAPCLVWVSRRGLWSSELLLLTLRCHRIAMVQPAESRK